MVPEHYFSLIFFIVNERTKDRVKTVGICSSLHSLPHSSSPGPWRYTSQLWSERFAPTANYQVPKDYRFHCIKMKTIVLHSLKYSPIRAQAFSVKLTDSLKLSKLTFKKILKTKNKQKKPCLQFRNSFPVRLKCNSRWGALLVFLSMYYLPGKPKP